jgi:molybdopterin-guanine dinucleotide biosynthesis protein A
MGRPKATVEIGGQPLWRRQADLLLGIGPAELMISAGEDWSVPPGPWAVVRDRAPGLGPVGGIGAALSSMTTGLLLVLAVDMPAMTAAYLRTLLASAGPGGVVPEDGGSPEGLAAIYPKAALAIVEEILGGDDRSVRHLVGRAAAQGLVALRPVASAERGLFRNVNRPGDLDGQ